MSTAVIMFVIANAGVFSFLLNRAGIPDALGVWLAQLFDTQFSFLMGVNPVSYTHLDVYKRQPLAYKFVVDFARDNHLKTEEREI